MGIFPRRVLLATDGSEDARGAYRAAVGLAQSTGAELHLVHAWRTEPSKAHAVTMPALRTAWYEQKAGELISKETERIENTGAILEGAHTVRGEAVEGILGVAADLGADLLVVGSRGLGFLGRLISGSVSEGVVRRAASPVLVAGGGERDWPPARVVAGVDFSEDSKEAARLTAAVGMLHGAPTLLVHAQPPLESGYRARVSPNDEGDARRAMVRLAREIGSELGEAPDARIFVGDPAGCVLGAAEGGRQPVLIGVGRRGLGALERLAAGSVSTAVARAAAGPVLVYRRP